jgi:hypothetical protein
MTTNFRSPRSDAEFLAVREGLLGPGQVEAAALAPGDQGVADVDHGHLQPLAAAGPGVGLDDVDQRPAQAGGLQIGPHGQHAQISDVVAGRLDPDAGQKGAVLDLAQGQDRRLRTGGISATALAAPPLSGAWPGP